MGVAGIEPPAQRVDHSVDLMSIVLLGANHPSAPTHMLNGSAGLVSHHRRPELDDPPIYLSTALVEHL